MATRLIKDHHNLRRNLKLNDNYISNDGGNEGIRIDNDGKVGIGTDDPDQILHIMVSDASVTQGNARSRLLIERNESAYMEFMLPSNAGAEAYQAGVILLLLVLLEDGFLMDLIMMILILVQVLRVYYYCKLEVYL